MKSDGEGGASSRHCFCNVSKQQSANNPSKQCGDADPSDQEEQKAEGDLERCSNKIHEGKQHQDSSQFFRSAYDFQHHNTDDYPSDFMR